MGIFERLFYSFGLMLAAWSKPEIFIALGLFEANRAREREEERNEMDTSDSWDKFQ